MQQTIDALPYILLAVVQGITEWLPVSSSGHLTIVEKLFHFNSDESLQLNIVLHLASLLALLFYFYRGFSANKNVVANNKYKKPAAHASNSVDKNSTGKRSLSTTLTRFEKKLVNICFAFANKTVSTFASRFRIGFIALIGKKISYNGVRLAVLVAIADSPAVVVGLYLRDYISVFSNSLWMLITAFAFSAAMLFLSLCANAKRNTITLSTLSLPKAFLIGIVQCLALLPGVSRSGTTISTAMLLGINGKDAAWFSLLLLAPLVIGASILEMLKAYSSPLEASIVLSAGWATIAVTFLITFFVSIVALRVLTHVSANYKLHYFAIYLIIVVIALTLWG